VPKIPKVKTLKANRPATGRSASAASLEDWMLVIPCTCNVVAVVTMIAIAVHPNALQRPSA